MNTRFTPLLRGLNLIPLAVGLVLGLFGVFNPSQFDTVLTGILVAIVGGTLVGYSARRWLSVSSGSWDTLLALSAVSLLGLLTWGIVYYIVLPDPIHTVSDPHRTALQLLIALQYLAALGLGISFVK